MQQRPASEWRANCNTRWVGTSRTFREAEELSQEAFAERLGFHRTYMAGIERGERNLTLRSVEKIADKLKIEPLLLLEGPIPRG